jgi:hypothetical protein
VTAGPDAQPARATMDSQMSEPLACDRPIEEVCHGRGPWVADAEVAGHAAG